METAGDLRAVIVYKAGGSYRVTFCNGIVHLAMICETDKTTYDLKWVIPPMAKLPAEADKCDCHPDYSKLPLSKLPQELVNWMSREAILRIERERGKGEEKK